MVLPNLTTNAVYEIKVRAASISMINPRQIVLGTYSEPKKVISTSKYIHLIPVYQNIFLQLSKVYSIS